MQKKNENLKQENKKITIKKKSPKEPIYFVILLVCIFITSSSYYFFIQNQSLTKKIEFSRNTIKNIGLNNQELNSELLNLKSNQNYLQNNLAKLNQDFSSLDIDNIRNFEIFYLLDLSFKKLNLDKDISQSIYYLEYVKLLLENEKNKGNFALIQAINKDIDALNQIKQPNLNIIYKKLQNLEKQIYNLKLSKVSSKQLTTKQNIPLDENLSFLAKFWQSLKEFLYNAVSFQEVSNINLLDEHNQKYIQEILFLKMQSLKTALLTKNYEVFNLEIKQTKDLAKKYLNNSDVNINFNQSLTQIGQSNLNIPQDYELVSFKLIENINFKNKQNEKNNIYNNQKNNSNFKDPQQNNLENQKENSTIKNDSQKSKIDNVNDQIVEQTNQQQTLNLNSQPKENNTKNATNTNKDEQNSLDQTQEKQNNLDKQEKTNKTQEQKTIENNQNDSITKDL